MRSRGKRGTITLLLVQQGLLGSTICKLTNAEWGKRGTITLLGSTISDAMLCHAFEGGESGDYYCGQLETVSSTVFVCLSTFAFVFEWNKQIEVEGD